jgi:tetratricopeptide (TPR) repeat protein
MRLNPHYPVNYLDTLGWAYFETARIEEAIGALKRAITRYPDLINAHRVLALCYSELGRKEEARAAAAEVLRLNPQFSLEVWGRRLPVKEQATLERYLTALRKAGLK